MFLANFSRQNQPCTDPASRRSPHFAELPPVFHPFLPTVLIPFGKKTSATVEFLSSLFDDTSKNFPGRLFWWVAEMFVQLLILSCLWINCLFVSSLVSHVFTAWPETSFHICSADWRALHPEPTGTQAAASQNNFPWSGFSSSSFVILVIIFSFFINISTLVSSITWASSLSTLPLPVPRALVFLCFLSFPFCGFGLWVFTLRSDSFIWHQCVAFRSAGTGVPRESSESPAFNWHVVPKRKSVEGDVEKLVTRVPCFFPNCCFPVSWFWNPCIGAQMCVLFNPSVCWFLL